MQIHFKTRKAARSMKTALTARGKPCKVVENTTGSRWGVVILKAK
jgi:hypothetical protein